MGERRRDHGAQGHQRRYRTLLHFRFDTIIYMLYIYIYRASVAEIMQHSGTSGASGVCNYIYII